MDTSVDDIIEAIVKGLTALLYVVVAQPTPVSLAKAVPVLLAMKEATFGSVAQALTQQLNAQTAAFILYFMPETLADVSVDTKALVNELKKSGQPEAPFKTVVDALVTQILAKISLQLQS